MTPWRVPYPKFGDGPGLARVSAIASRLGLDLAAFGACGAVIVGSNGKGSTAAMTASLLETQWIGSVGLFTSPHLFDLNERFRIDGADITDDELGLHWRRVADAIDAYQAESKVRVGGFEFLFLIAADWFAARGVAHTVWEAGIGGRLDPVKLIKARSVALTSLDLEHTELLGDTLEAIARDKIEAAPPGAKLFAPADIPVRQVIASACAERGVALTLVPPLDADVSLPGAHQRANAALAVALARDLTAIDATSIARGLSATRWPGRLEVISAAPLAVIDVGHTPGGIAAALAGFQTLRGERPAILVCGASHDKNVAQMISVLAPEFDVVICAQARHKGAAAGEIALYAQRANPRAEIIVAESVTEAHALVFARARAAQAAIYAAGGLFLAAEFKAVHVGRDPATLAFF
ncbi:MAG: cyanophycin synthetase [Terricaulis sp.]